MIAFDKAAAPLMQMVDMMGDAPIERQFRVVRHIVERLTVRDGELATVEARPFFGVVAMAPPDGRGALTTKPEEKLAAYL